MPVINLQHVAKCFSLERDRPRSFQEAALNFLRPGRRARGREIFWALRDISFSVAPGEAVGLIGSNGSGKSTCLKLVSRIIEPTSGTVSVTGRISALLELGTGFHPELSGRDNIYLYGSVLGLRRQEMVSRFERIVSFAELDRFIDIPVKFYSSGMYVRLAFATAINVSADILLIDEVLAVGDQSFQTRCLERIQDLRRRGVTILFVSHSLEAVRTLCDRAIWLDDGLLRDDGAAEGVVSHYLQHVYEEDEANALAEKEAGREGRGLAAPAPDQRPVRDGPADGGSPEYPADPPEEGDVMASHRSRWGTGEAEIVDVTFLDEAGRERLLLTTSEPATVVVHYRAPARIATPMFGLGIHRADGLHVTGPNSVFAGYEIAFIEGEGEVRYHVEALPLLAGTYYLTVAICDHTGACAYDYCNLGYRFRVQAGATAERYGAVHIPARWEHVPIPRPVLEQASP